MTPGFSARVFAILEAERDDLLARVRLGGESAEQWAIALGTVQSLIGRIHEAADEAVADVLIKLAASDDMQVGDVQR